VVEVADDHRHRPACAPGAKELADQARLPGPPVAHGREGVFAAQLVELFDERLVASAFALERRLRHELLPALLVPVHLRRDRERARGGEVEDDGRDLVRLEAGSMDHGEGRGRRSGQRHEQGRELPAPDDHERARIDGQGETEQVGREAIARAGDHPRDGDLRQGDQEKGHLLRPARPEAAPQEAEPGQRDGGFEQQAHPDERGGLIGDHDGVVQPPARERHEGDDPSDQRGVSGRDALLRAVVGSHRARENGPANTHP
jgi:hypothetical protein